MALGEMLDRIPESELEEMLSEISDFLDLDDEMLSDLELFDGVDCALNREAPAVTKSAVIGAEGHSSLEEQCPQRGRLSTLIGTNSKEETEGIPSENSNPADFSRKTGSRETKRSGRRKASNNICPICRKSFQQKGHLRSHLLLHTGERPFVCEICDKSFSQSGHLISHINSHTSNRPYGCDFCEKRFTQSGHKRNHERSHLGIRPYECVQCNKRFTQSGHLVNHLRIHDGDKPYKCDVCSKTFTQSGHLSSHKKTHIDLFE